MTLFLALDVSSSVKGQMLDQLKTAARAAVQALRDDDSAALLTFSQRIDRPATITRDRQGIIAAIDRMRAEGSTALRDAVFAATVLREQAPGRVILLVFTDGMDTVSWLDTPTVIEAALRSDMVIYTVTTQPLPPRAFTRASTRTSLSCSRGLFLETWPTAPAGSGCRSKEKRS